MSSSDSNAATLSKPAQDAQDAQCMITQHNYMVSALLRLPAELRNKIYLYAFGSQDVYVDKIEFSDQICFYGHESGHLSVHSSLTFMTTCRQIYSETKILYWRTRMFRIGPPDLVSQDTTIRNWLKILQDEQRSAITRIAIHKDDFKLDALWDELPRLRGLRQVVPWGSYFMWGSDRVLAGIVEEINDRVDKLVGHHVEVNLEKAG